MRISDWSSDVCSSDLTAVHRRSRSGAILDCAGRFFPSRRREPHDRHGAPPRAAAPGVSRSVEPAGLSSSIGPAARSEEHTSELQSLMRISYAVFCLKKKTKYMYTI